MGISAQGGTGEEDLEQFVLCPSDEWKCLLERTWVASSPFVQKMQRCMTSPVKSASCNAC